MLRILGNVCVGCGTDNNLHIHHKDQTKKSFNPSRDFSRPWSEIVVELKKCEIRCEPCHKKEHAGLEHGISGYTHRKCRCDVCRKAWNKHMQEYKKRRKNAGITQLVE